MGTHRSAAQSKIVARCLRGLFIDALVLDSLDAAPSKELLESAIKAADDIGPSSLLADTSRRMKQQVCRLPRFMRRLGSEGRFRRQWSGDGAIIVPATAR
jgi:hypothetical protein